ncbi:MAG: hypothetical protein ACREAS_01010 [Nitrososphaera sp.]
MPEGEEKKYRHYNQRNMTKLEEEKGKRMIEGFLTYIPPPV